ncbi:restriction endonuclease [Rheinheimera riviphila]|uniref:Restriction endonuclease n=1 Tax=Rheinheimera riviphila TaxID=1834037 RepID=A0A437QLT8_9GAMM|nr:McrC family protein [Rheinheimera riviphila]RVU35420.1 restriction endonuclease [Rheinheimera riviphila]
MNKAVIVREYARLTFAELAENTLDQAQISPSAFRWLVELGQQFRANGLALLELDNQQWLRLDNYVGVLESPCGQVIEILPKHRSSTNCIESARQLLCKLICNALDIKSRNTSHTSIERFDTSLPEWLMRQFLQELDTLFKRGLRFDYQRVEEQQRFLHGRLDVNKQLRQPPGREHLFNIQHDIFSADRAENRLLKTALSKVCTATQDSENWRLAHELQSLLHELPQSTDIQQDFRHWQESRLMAHYQAIKPWCEFVLNLHVPLAVQGDWRGLSLLFPMEKLFENYVAAELGKALAQTPGTDKELRTQLASRYLCTHLQQDMFQLKPDLSLSLGGLGQPTQRWILDTKWKLLDGVARDDKYGLSQQDFYQMFAYGHTYLKGHGTLVLIFPAWDKFPVYTKPLHFSFDPNLQLLALPFDLEDENSAKTLISLLQHGFKQSSTAAA